MLSYDVFFSKPSIAINDIWKPLIRKEDDGRHNRGSQASQKGCSTSEGNNMKFNF